MGYPRQPWAFQGAAAAARLPPHAVRTYEVDRPRQTHSRPATCAEKGCTARANGWVTVADERTPAGKRIAFQVRRLARPVGAVLAPAVAARVRRYVETHDPDGTTRFAFPAGQECFEPHRIELERPALYIVRDGDFRGNPRRTDPIRFRDGSEWVESSMEHQAGLAAEHQKG